MFASTLRLAACRHAGRLWLELFGCIVFALPYLLMALPYAHAFFVTSFLQNEGSPAPNGLGMRWVIKGFLYFGFWSVFFAVVSVMCRRIVFLFGDAELAETAMPGGSTRSALRGGGMSDWFVDHLAVIMFLVLTFIMFVGYPVAFVLGATGVFFALLGIYAGVFKPAQFASLLPRIYAQAVENQALVAIPMFIFMGTMLEKSKVAEQLLYALQVLLRRVPGGLAIAVTLLGTIMAATTGIVGASVVMLTLIALPVMMQRGYNKELAVGTIASAGTLGILIPPSIMLVIMGDLMTVPVGTLFAGAIIPGLVMSSLYVVYIIALCYLKPSLAPPLGAEEGPQNRAELIKLVTWSFAPAAFLITLVLGSIFAGWATPTEAAGVGCAGAMLLAVLNRQFNLKILTSVLYESATTNALVFFIVFGATLFSYVFRALGGDDVVAEILKGMGIDTGWEMLIFVMALVFFMGFFFDWIEICLVVIPIFAPLIGKFDYGSVVQGQQVILLWFGILLAVNMQTAFLTPPFGFALFYMKGTVPPTVTMAHIYRGIVPFVLIQLVALALCMIFPRLYCYCRAIGDSPGLMEPFCLQACAPISRGRGACNAAERP